MKYGFLGLGIMGSRMATRLLQAGLDVTVWNRDSAKAEPLVARGARRGTSPQAVAAETDLVFVMVSDPEASWEVCGGPEGAWAGLKPGQGYVDFSTVDPGTAERVAQAVEARGARFLEAPVSGTKKPAEDGTLVILAAGDRGLFDDCQPAFRVLGKRSEYLGAVGQGAKMKLVINLLLGTMTEILGEALALGRKAGLPGDTLLSVLGDSALANPLFAVKGPMMLQGDTTPSFPLKHMEKDLVLAVALGRDVGQNLPITLAVQELFSKALVDGLGDEDLSAVGKIS